MKKEKILNEEENENSVNNKSLTIELDSNWFIIDNAINGYELVKWNGKVSGKQNIRVYERQIYPKDLISAILWYARYKIVEDNEKLSLDQYMEEYKRIVDSVFEKLQRFYLK